MLKGSILVSFIFKIFHILNGYYEASLCGRFMKKLGQVLTSFLGGSFFHRLVLRNYKKSVFAKFLSGLVEGIGRGQKSLARILKAPLEGSLVYAYISGYQEERKGLMNLALSLAIFGLVLSLGDPSKKTLAVLGLGIFLLILARLQVFYSSSHLGQVGLGLKDLIYEEEGHDQ